MQIAVAFWKADAYPYFVDLDADHIHAMIAEAELEVRDMPEMLEGYHRMLKHNRTDFEMPGYVIHKGNEDDWFLARVVDI